jgi:hypothetical protein
MLKLTKEQRTALKRIFDRGPILPAFGEKKPFSYLWFRRNRVHGTIGCDDAIAVQWRGMWLAIERDGYTHS